MKLNKKTSLAAYAARLLTFVKLKRADFTAKTTASQERKLLQICNEKAVVAVGKAAIINLWEADGPPATNGE